MVTLILLHFSFIANYHLLINCTPNGTIKKSVEISCIIIHLQAPKSKRKSEAINLLLIFLPSNHKLSKLYGCRFFQCVVGRY